MRKFARQPRNWTKDSLAEGTQFEARVLRTEIESSKRYSTGLRCAGDATEEYKVPTFFYDPLAVGYAYPALKEGDVVNGKLFITAPDEKGTSLVTNTSAVCSCPCSFCPDDITGMFTVFSFEKYGIAVRGQYCKPCVKENWVIVEPKTVVTYHGPKIADGIRSIEAVVYLCIAVEEGFIASRQQVKKASNA